MSSTTSIPGYTSAITHPSQALSGEGQPMPGEVPNDVLAQIIRAVESAIQRQTESNSSATSDAQTTSPMQSFGAQLISGVYQTVVSAGAGYLAGMVFSLIDPIGGAVFGATSTVSSIALNLLVGKLGISNTYAKVAVWAVSFIASIGIAALVTTTVGFPITLMGAAWMTLAIGVTSIAVHIVTAGTLCCSACIGAVALGLCNRTE